MNEQHRNFAGLIRLEHVDAGFVLQLVRGQESFILQEIRLALRQPIGQRRRQIAFERNGRPIHLSGLIDEGVQ